MTLDVPSLRRQPAGERIGAEVLVRDEAGNAGGGEAREPRREQSVQFVLADADRGIRPQQIEAHVRGYAGFVDDGDVRDVVARHRHACHFAGALVHFDGPDRGVGSQSGEVRRNCPAAASEVAERATGRGRRGILEQNARTPVEITAVEDAAIEGEFPFDSLHAHGGEAGLGVAR